MQTLYERRSDAIGVFRIVPQKSHRLPRKSTPHYHVLMHHLCKKAICKFLV